MRNFRYAFLIDCIPILQPKIIIEIGVATGKRSVQMIIAAMNYYQDVKFIGYDVFDTKDDEWHEKVGNGKEVYSKHKIHSILSKITNNIELIEGMTQETLWNSNIYSDLVFIDGDHRVKSIENDFSSVQSSKVVVFDDYYFSGEHHGKKGKKTIDEYGCNLIVNKLPREEVLITPETIKFSNIRLAFWVKEKHLLEKIKLLLK